MREHDKEHFFKYTSFNTAIKIIRNHKLRWSSPLLFNDPFDNQIDLHIPFDGNQLTAALVSELESIAFGDERQFQERTPVRTLALTLRGMRDRLSRAEVGEYLREGTREMAEQFQESVNTLHRNIRRELVRARILCVSEFHNNVVMWSHYAEHHKGVVFQLRCMDELDNALLAAKRVRYSNDLPQFPSLRSYIKHLTGEKVINFGSLFLTIPFIKHSDWSYEGEWRVYQPLLDEPDRDGVSYYHEDRRIFSAVYLGCEMSEENGENIVRECNEHLPECEIYKGMKSESSFELIFHRIK